MRRRNLDQFLLLSTAIFVVLAVAAVVAIQWFAAREIDVHDREATAQTLRGAVRQYGTHLSESSFAQTYWDDAVIHLDNRFSEEWARQYIGTFFWRTAKIERIATLDRDDRVTFTMSDGETRPPSDAEPLLNAARGLVAIVRSEETARGPLPKLRQFDGRASAPTANPSTLQTNARGSLTKSNLAPALALKPITASGTVAVGGVIYSVVATLVQPDAIANPVADRSAIVILGKRLTPALVTQIGDNVGIDPLELYPSEDAVPSGRPHIALRDPGGKPIAELAWRDANPGLQVVRHTAPALAICSLLLALTAILGLRRGRSIARELTDSEVRASLLAYRDKLTGLPNRAGIEVGYEDILRHADRHLIPMHVGCIDIDRFKAVNDSHGHATGDELLRQAAARIEACCEGNYLLGRFGGDEFVLLCDGHTETEVNKIAQEVIGSLSQPFEINGARAFVGCSIGVLSLDPGENLEASEALRRADLAMYHAKKLGGNHFAFYGEHLDEVVRARADVHDRLRTALQEETLEVWYQPQCDAEGRILSAEALVRWPSNLSPGVPTADFIKLAEQTGLIDGLGVHVVRRVIADAALWPHLPLAVNLSAMQLAADEPMEQLVALIEDSGIDPARFEFEITEGLLLDQSEDTIRRIEKLRAMGCCIALDDFGTGYCGLSYLHRYPIDRVKIDMSFVSMLGKEPRAQPLVETIIALARSLDLDVIAEGVETESQRQALLRAGCRKFQGFLTGRPMPASALSERLADEAVAISQPVP